MKKTFFSLLLPLSLSEEGDRVLAVVGAAVEHLAHRHRVHRRVPRHVGHEDHQRVQAVGIALDRGGDHVVHHSVGRQRMLPGERVVDAQRRAVGVHRQLLGAGGKPERRRVQRRVGLHEAGVVEGAIVRDDVPRIGRLVPEAPRRIDRAQHAHEDRQRAHGLEAVGVGRQPAHGMARIVHPALAPVREVTIVSAGRSETIWAAIPLPGTSQ